MKNTILIFGGTGFLGKSLAKRFLLEGHDVCVFSRSEDKHRQIRAELPGIKTILGDVRDYHAILAAIKGFYPDIIIAAQALKQIHLCEEMPFEAVQTNILGTENLCKAVKQYEDSYFHLDKNGIKFLYISTDKSAAPSTLYGMTKGVAERLHLSWKQKGIYNNCCRYGNVLGSTGSIIPVYKELLKQGKELPITNYEMTRFLLTIDDAINLIVESLTDMGSNKIFIPKAKSARILDLAEIMIEKYVIKETALYESGIRPLEKLHEVFFSTEELSRIQKLENKFVIHDINSNNWKDVKKEYSSGDKENLMDKKELKEFLERNKVLE